MTSAAPGAIRSRWPRRIAALVLIVLASALFAAAAARWALRAASRAFDASATETVAEWAARHSPREANATARAIDEILADVWEPRPADPAPAVRGNGGQAWFLIMTHAHEAERARDSTPLPAPAALRAWMDAREPELDRVVALLTGMPSARWEIAAGDPFSVERARVPAARLPHVLVSRALDDAARGMSERAGRDLAAAWALQEAWAGLPRHPWPIDDETLGAIRVVAPEPAAWIARLQAMLPRGALHDEILVAAAGLPARAAEPWSGDVPEMLPRFLVTAKSPFVRAVRELGAARTLRRLGRIDAALAARDPCADPSDLAWELPDAWLSEELPLGLTFWVDRRMVMRLRASEVSVALTRRALELRAGRAQSGDPCAQAWLVETPGPGGATTVAWNGALPAGLEAWANWFPEPFTVPAPGRPGRSEP